MAASWGGGVTGRVMDLVTVFHNATNRRQAYQLADQVHEHADCPYVMFFGDNTIENIGFGPRCNKEAANGTGEVIGFLNPDANIHGPFMQRVFDEFARNRHIVITGERFGKPKHEIRAWGLRDWVCGAAFFVRRSWWERVGGFNPDYVWGWEETDLCRRAEASRRIVSSIELPITHESPGTDSTTDAAYKQRHFERGAALYRKQWGRR